MRRRLLALAAGSGLIASLAACGGGSDGLDPVEIGLAVEKDVSNLAFIVAEEQGFYEQCGLDATVTFFQGGGALMPPLASGDVDFGWVGTTAVVAAVEEGSPVKTIAEISQSAGGWGIVVGEDSPLQTLDDLDQGAAISFTSEGSLSHWFALWAAKQAGLSPDDVTGVPLGGSVPAIGAALDKGDVDAAAVLLPWGHILEDEGKRWLARFEDELPEMNYTGLHANESVLDDGDKAARVVGAYVLTAQWMNDHPDETIEFISNQYDLEEDLAEVAYELVVPDLNSTGEFTEERMQFLLDTVAEVPGFVEGTLEVDDILANVSPAACEATE